jgi:hypothetical protein
MALGGTLLSGGALQVSVTVVCLALGACGFKKWRDGVRIESGLAPAPSWEKWMSLLLLVPISYVGYAVFRDAIVFDGLVNWEAKARHAFLAGGSLPASYFADATRSGYHPRYPLYLPYSELWVYLWVGDCDQTLVKVLFPLFYAAALLVVWSGTLRCMGRVWVATATSLVPLFVPFMADHGFGLVQGYPEFPLAALYLVSVAALAAWRLRGFESGWIVAMSCGSLLPWVKQDGIILFVSLLGVSALIHGWRDWRRWMLFAAPGVLVAVCWRVGMHWVHAVEEPNFEPLTVENLIRALPRFGPIARAIGDRLSTLRNWSLLWYWVPWALLCVAWRGKKLGFWLFAALAIPLVLDIPPYLLTRLDLQFHLMTSLDRLVLQISLVAVFSLGLALGAVESAEGQSAPMEGGAKPREAPAATSVGR